MKICWALKNLIWFSINILLYEGSLEDERRSEELKYFEYILDSYVRWFGCAYINENALSWL